jgi:signal transduction histidine kinase
MSQIEAGRMLLDEDPFNLAESTKSVIKMLSLRAHAKNLDLTYEIDPQLPEILYGDSVRVRQIMTNLIANAIKFTSTGGVRVRLNAVGNFQRVRCEVIDSGIGVSDGVRNRIFDAFFQADGTTRRRFGGTGLGLTVSKQLVEIMGGEIGTYNNGPESSGATFWFELPLRAEPATELRSTQS